MELRWIPLKKHIQQDTGGRSTICRVVLRVLAVLDAWRNIVLADLVQQRAIADAQQLRSSLSIPASPPQSTVDRVYFRLIAEAPQRQITHWLYTSHGRDLATARLPCIWPWCASTADVLALGFRVIHIIPTDRKFSTTIPRGTLVASHSETSLPNSINGIGLNRFEAVSINADRQRSMDRFNRDDQVAIILSG